MAKIPEESIPTVADTEVLALCQHLVPNTKPILVPIRPWSKAVPSECFDNVERYILTHGGQRLLGWRPMRWANIMVEAEAHAVWCSPAGELLDITPCEQASSLFLPDPNMIHTGYPHANVRQALTNSSLVADLIDVSNQIDRLRISVKSGEPYAVPSELVIRQARIFNILNDTDAKRNSFCPCQSGMKFKKCCGRF